MRFPCRKPKRRWESSLGVFSSPVDSSRESTFCQATAPSKQRKSNAWGLLAVAKAKEPVNPFYVLLVVLGVVFLITACAYGMMAYRAISPAAARGPSGHALTDFLDRHGIELMGGELLLLAAATFGAMWLDGLRTRRAEANQTPNDRESGPKMG